VLKVGSFPWPRPFFVTKYGGPLLGSTEQAAGVKSTGWHRPRTPSNRSAWTTRQRCLVSGKQRLHAYPCPAFESSFLCT